MTQERPGERDTGVLQTESQHSEMQETIDDLRQKLSATEHDAFSSRCRYSSTLHCGNGHGSS